MAQVFDTPINTTDQSIDRVLGVSLPVVLLFVDNSASLDDTINRLAREHAGQLLIVKVRPSENPASVKRFEIGATPALVTARGGQTQTRAAPATAAELERHVAFLLGRGPRPEAPRPVASGSGRPVAVTDADFDRQVLQSPEPVLIDFWAPWCAPCRMIAPIVERLAQELAGRLRVVKVNIDENPQVQARFGIQSIPIMMIFKNGQAIDRWVGAQPERAIRQRLKQAVGIG